MRLMVPLTAQRAEPRSSGAVVQLQDVQGEQCRALWDDDAYRAGLAERGGKVLTQDKLSK